MRNNLALIRPRLILLHIFNKNNCRQVDNRPFDNCTSTVNLTNSSDFFIVKDDFCGVITILTLIARERRHTFTLQFYTNAIQLKIEAIFHTQRRSIERFL